MKVYIATGIVLGLVLLYLIHKIVAFKRLRFGGVMALLVTCCSIGTIAVFVLRRFLFFVAGYALVGLVVAIFVWLALHRRVKKSAGKG